MIAIPVAMEKQIADLTAKLAEAERERDSAKFDKARMLDERQIFLKGMEELRAEVARLEKESRLHAGVIGNLAFAIQEHKEAREAAEARLTALRDAVDNAPCHDFCRWQQTRHEIPYGTHHPACWKVAALAKSADALAPIDRPAAT